MAHGTVNPVNTSLFSILNKPIFGTVLCVEYQGGVFSIYKVCICHFLENCVGEED